MKDRQEASHGEREKPLKGNLNETSGQSPNVENKSEGRTDRSFYK